MPLYPPSPPVLVGDNWNISRFLEQPAFVDRRLRTLTDRKFLADFLLPGRIKTSGGAIAYVQNEPIETDRLARAVAPGGAYPRAMAPTGTMLTASVQKWGQEVPLTDEAIGRQMNHVVSIDRILTQIGNRIISQVDSLMLASIAVSVTQTQGAKAPWTSEDADPFADVMDGAAKVFNLTDGFETDTVVCSASLYAKLVANRKVIDGLQREGTNQVTKTGEVKEIAGHILVQAPDTRMPAGMDVFVTDRLQLGSLGYEVIPSPGYAGDPANGIETLTRRDDANDQWLLRGRRPVVPVIQEPSSTVKITGAAA